MLVHRCSGVRTKAAELTIIGKDVFPEVHVVHLCPLKTTMESGVLYHEVITVTAPELRFINGAIVSDPKMVFQGCE